jgi:hypothetical protein
MTLLYVADDHEVILDLWRRHDATGVRLLHVDDHCDMRGLLVDSAAHRVSATRDAVLQSGVVYGGNFLTWAVLERRVAAVRWVFGRTGGRAEDVKTIKHLTDLSALPYRLGLRRPTWLRFDYEAIPDEQWSGRLWPDEHLDLDWDFFASRRGPRTGIAERAGAFLARLLGPPPPAIYLAYSERYSHPSRDLFESFCRELADRFSARAERLAQRPARRSSTPALHRRTLWAAQRWLHRRGIY